MIPVIISCVQKKKLIELLTLKEIILLLINISILFVCYTKDI